MASVELKHSKLDRRSEDIAEASDHRAVVRASQATLATSAATNKADHDEREEAKRALTRKIGR